MFKPEDGSSLPNRGPTKIGAEAVTRSEMDPFDQWPPPRLSALSLAERSNTQSGAGTGGGGTDADARDRGNRGVGAANRQVLVVEDDLFSQKLLATILAQAGFGYDVAGDGSTAIRILEQGRFGLILMDVQLPIMGGIDVIRKVRAGRVQGCDPTIPIIAVTAYAMRGDREFFLREGATDYMSKPIDIAQMMVLVRHYLDQPHRTDS